nr:hypothetical protein [Tanacetum cinerariifolium]GFA52638.1 hypothetical protein [Tanacetum cinerariifolium]
MEALVINISFDLSEESLTSVVSRVILFGTIPTEIPIVPDMPTDLPIAPELPAVSPFLCSDDSKSKPTDHLRDTYHIDFMNTWFLEIATASPACISTPVIIASPAVPLLKACQATLSLKTSLSDTSSGSSLDLAPASFSSSRPSQKRIQSSATSIPSVVHTAAGGRYAGERSSLLACVVALEGSNTILQDDLGVESVRAQKGLSSLDWQHHELGVDYSSSNRLIDENQSQNRDDNDNRSGGNGNHDGALTWWNSHVQTIRIDEAYEMPWKDLMKLMIEVYFLRNEIQLTLLCPMMVPEENDKIERFIWGFPDNIQGNHVQQPPFKRRNVAQAVTMDNNKKRGYAGSASYGNKYRWHHEGPCTVKCTSCKKGHYMSDCPKLKKHNRRNKAVSNDAHGRPYALGGGD